MINIVAGYFENKNILEASKEASSIEDLNVSIANSEQELINAFKDPGVDAVVRGSLKSHEIMKFLKEYKKDNAINRATFINTFDDEDFLEDYEFLLAPVGIDEGKTIDERLEIAIQAALFLKSINKQPKIAILAAGRKDDFGRTLGIDKNLKESEDLCEKITQKLNDLDAFDNDSDDESRHFEVKNYYILIEKAIKEGNNIILAPDGVTGNIIFRTLVLLNSWPSNGAVTLGIDEIFVDTSRDQSVEGYLRSIKLAYDLAKAKKEMSGKSFQVVARIAKFLLF